MKIGIATVHDSANFGSFLQAYALQKVLAGYGHDVFFIRTRGRQYLASLYRPHRRAFMEHPQKAVREYLYGRQKRRAFLSDQRYFNEIDIEETDKMDLIILGSDEIWNVNTPVFRLPVFYGAGIKAPVMTYAVSASSAGAGDIERYGDIALAIRNMQYVLVRDNNTADMCERLRGERPEIVCDPTLLLNPEDYMRPLSTRLVSAESYIAVYAYSDYINEGFKEAVRTFADKNGIKIVAVGFFHKWADENIVCGPMDFLNVLSGAKYVVTTTFHGTIYSILGQKRFVSMPLSPKTNDVLGQLGLGERIIGKDFNGETLEELLCASSEIDYDTVSDRILKLRDFSMGKLVETIEDCAAGTGRSKRGSD